MRRKSSLFIILAAFLVLAGVVADFGRVFAANIYNINYSGGVPLSEDNVIVDSSVQDLVRLNIDGEVTITPSDSNKWVKAYVKSATSSACIPRYFIRVWNSNRITDSDDVYYVISNSDYDIKVQLKKIITENASGVSQSGDTYIISAGTNGNITAGYNEGYYKTSSCTTEYDNIRALSSSNDERIFVEVNIKVYKHGTDEIFKSGELYFGMTDIDASQSYKILSPNAMLTSGQMYSASTIPFSVVDGKRNMFVESGNYIYSQPNFSIDTGSSIYVKLDKETQIEGLDVVFGFHTKAGSGVVYYARQLDVKYESDNNGVVSGKTEEAIFYEDNPSGSETTPNTGFVLIHWIADKDVTLEDETVIAAGQPITPAQVQQVVVTEELTFTAIHEARYIVNYVSDSHGTITTGELENEVLEPNTSPTGSVSAPNEHYEFKHWIADKDVTLTDDTVIAAGQPLTPSQVEQVVVTKDLTFTAIHEEIIYRVNYASDEHGQISGKENEDVVEGDNPTGSVSTPNEHYEFKHWTADKDVTLTDGAVITAGQPLTPAQVEQVIVTEPLTFTAIHDPIMFHVDYTSDEHGIISGLGSEDKIEGSNPSGSASTPNEHCEFKHWTADKDVTLTDSTVITAGQPLTSAQVQQVVIVENLTFTAIHEAVNHHVSYVSDDHGIITGISGEDIFESSNPSGSSSTPNEHYEFKHWTADKDVTLTDGAVITAGQPLTSAQVQQVVIVENLTFTAIHKEIKFHITYESDEHGRISGIDGEDVVETDNPSGSTSTPDDTYIFEHWIVDKDVTLEDGTEIEAGHPITPTQVEQVVVTEDLIFTAVHKEIVYHVTYESDEHGRISGIEDEDIVINHNPTGSESTPDEHYEFIHWITNKDVILEDDTEIEAGQPLTPAQVEQVIVTGDITFTATHKKEQLRIAYDTDGHGEISGITAEDVYYLEYPSGSTSTPATHYEFKHWVADRDVTLADDTVIVAGQPLTPGQVQQVIATQNLTFTAVHEKIQYRIIYGSDDNGDITGIRNEDADYEDLPSGSESTPNEHYEFKHWVADVDVVLTDGTEIEAGEPIASDQVEQIVVTQNINLTAIHEKIQYKITYESEEDGKITGITDENANYEDSPSGTEITPNEGYEFDYWIAGVDVVLTDGTEIKAGEPISPDQVKQIIVEQDIVLTAIYRAAPAPAPEVPNTGANTDEDGHATVTTFTGLGAAAAFITFGIVRLFRRHRANKFN